MIVGECWHQGCRWGEFLFKGNRNPLSSEMDRNLEMSKLIARSLPLLYYFLTLVYALWLPLCLSSPVLQHLSLNLYHHLLGIPAALTKLYDKKEGYIQGCQDFPVMTAWLSPYLLYYMVFLAKRITIYQS